MIERLLDKKKIPQNGQKIPRIKKKTPQNDQMIPHKKKKIPLTYQ